MKIHDDIRSLKLVNVNIVASLKLIREKLFLMEQRIKDLEKKSADDDDIVQH